MQKKLRVAGYARVSTDKDNQQNSLKSQRTYFSNYIKEHKDWEFVDVYYDEGVSGTQTKKREGFNKMMEDALNGEIDLILTKEISRFSRNTVDTLSKVRELKAHGVGVIFTIDNIDTRESEGELRLTIMASIAQEESRKISERVRWGQKRRMEAGVVFGRDLLGYKVVNGQLFINEEEADIVRLIFNKYTNEGKGTLVIARELHEEGIHPKRVSRWTNTTILKILRNEKYAGDLLQKKTFTPDYLTHAKKYNHGQEDMVFLENHHEPIIERELWKRTQEELERRSTSDEQKLKYSNRYWCSGKIRCAECGNSYVPRYKKLKNNNIYKAWRCFATAQHGAYKKDSDGNYIGCDNSSISERSLQFCMSYAISLIQIEREALKKEILSEIKQLQKDSDKRTDTQKIQKKINEVEDKKRRLIDLVVDGTLSKDDLNSQTEWYNEQLENLQNQLTESIHQDKLNNRKVVSMEKYINTLDKIMDVDADNELIYRRLLDHVDVHKEKVLDVWLKEIPVGIRLKIKTSGRGKTFKTEILEASIIEK